MKHQYRQILPAPRRRGTEELTRYQDQDSDVNSISETSNKQKTRETTASNVPKQNLISTFDPFGENMSKEDRDHAEWAEQFDVNVEVESHPKAYCRLVDYICENEISIYFFNMRNDTPDDGHGLEHGLKQLELGVPFEPCCKYWKYKGQKIMGGPTTSFKAVEGVNNIEMEYFEMKPRVRHDNEIEPLPELVDTGPLPELSDSEPPPNPSDAEPLPELFNTEPLPDWFELLYRATEGAK